LVRAQEEEQKLYRDVGLFYYTDICIIRLNTTISFLQFVLGGVACGTAKSDKLTYNLIAKIFVKLQVKFLIIKYLRGKLLSFY